MAHAAGFSYTLYLLHWPVLTVVSDLWLSPKMPFAARFWLLVLIGLPVNCLLAYVSSLVFERPFLGSRFKKTAMMQTAALLPRATLK